MYLVFLFGSLSSYCSLCKVFFLSSTGQYFFLFAFFLPLFVCSVVEASQMLMTPLLHLLHLFAPWPFSAEHTRLQYDESLPPAICGRYPEQLRCHTRALIFKAFISLSAGDGFCASVTQIAAPHGHIIHDFDKQAPTG